MDISIETITPHIAREMLGRNEKNRHMRLSHINNLANEMTADRWKNDGSPIRFSKSGFLIDGQHRLNAVVKSGVTLEMVVMRGLDDEVFQTIDTGAARTAGDVLSIESIPNANVVAACARMVASYQKTGHPGQGDSSFKMSNSAVLDFVNSNPLIVESAAFGSSSLAMRKLIKCSVSGWLHYVASDAGQREQVEKFLNEVSRPTPESYGTTAMLLREKLIMAKNPKERMTKMAECAYVVKSYRDFRDGKRVSYLRLLPPNGVFTKEYFAL